MNQRRTTSSLVFTNYLDELRRAIMGLISTVALVISVVLVINVIASQGQLQLWFVMLPIIFGVVLVGIVRRIAIPVFANVVVVALVISVFVTPTPLTAMGIALIVLVVIPFIAQRVVFIGALAFLTIGIVRIELLGFDPESFQLAASPIAYVLVMVVLSILLRNFRDRLGLFIANTRQNTDLMNNSIAITASMAAYTDETELVQHAVQALHTQLGFYHARVYLTDGRSNAAELAAMSGSSTVAHNDHTSQVISTRNIIGRALLSGEIIVLRADTSQASLTDHEYLPETRAEAVIPLIDRERVIGAIDLHSRTATTFTPEALTALQVLANAMAQAIRLARVTQEQQASLNDKRRIAQENESNLREVERLSRQLTRQTWTEYVKNDDTITGVTLLPTGFRPGAEWTPAMTQAVQRRRPVSETHTNGGTRTVAIAIELRHEVIGALEVTLTEGAYMSETIELLRTVTERLAVSLENARLFEEAQAATAQEQRINDIVTELQSVDSVEMMLQRTLEGLSEALGTDDLAIRLGQGPAGANGGTHD